MPSHRVGRWCGRSHGLARAPQRALRRAWLVLCLSPLLAAQAGTPPPAPPIDDDKLVLAVEARCAELRDQGRLVLLDDLHAKPPAASVELRLAAPGTVKLEPPDLYAALRRSALLVGVYYRCTECDGWHFDAASGFVLSDRGAVATCWHVLEKDPDRRETFCVVADDAGHVWPIRSVLAADAVADVCVVAAEVEGHPPLPLRIGARVGERVWCVSNPDHRFAFFSEGMIARSFVSREPRPESESDAGAIEAPLTPGTPSYEVTLDFALGSSGAAIVDACGNVVGLAQATTTIVYAAGDADSDVQMVVKIAAPAAAVYSLVRAPR